MVAFNPEASCKEAEAHYFNFLAEDDSDIVPRNIIDHIIGCRHCRSKIEQLNRLLGLTPSIYVTSKIDTVIGTMLKLHFAYLGKPVSCKTVKPFLPTLLDPTLEIRIPTPITMHLDHCQSCSEDLETIRKLNLNRGQLCRLSQMYADRPKDKYIACPKAQTAINSVVNLSLHKTTADVLKHLCLCSYCRELVSEARKFAIRLPSESAKGSEDLPCNQASPSDIFDYAVPYGLDPSSDQYAKFRESFTSHIRKCPKCMGKIQDLHQTLFGIIDQPESGVVTVCNTIESPEADMQTAKHPENLYSGFPIRVEVSGPQNVKVKKQPISASSGTLPGTRMFTVRRLTSWAKYGGIAAVLVIVVSLFFFTLPSAKAVTLDEIYEAVLKVKNVYIVSFTSGQTESTQKKWVSRSLGIYMTSAGDERSLWDIHRGIRDTHTSKTDEAKQVSLSSEDTARIESIINSSLDLMPFENISEMPKDAQWQRLADVKVQGDTSNLEVYDLLWTEKSYVGPATKNQWRVYVDPETKLPQRTEFYQMLPGEQEFILKSFKVIEYPTDDEMQVIIEKLSV